MEKEQKKKRGADKMKEDKNIEKGIIIQVEDNIESKKGLSRAIKVTLNNITLFDAIGVIESAKFQMMSNRLSNEPQGSMDYVG